MEWTEKTDEQTGADCSRLRRLRSRLQPIERNTRVDYEDRSRLAKTRLE